MTKFRMTWVMEVDDDELLELVNDYQDAIEENCFATLKEVSEELMLEVLEDSGYVSDEISEFLDADTITIKLMSDEEV